MQPMREITSWSEGASLSFLRAGGEEQDWVRLLPCMAPSSSGNGLVPGPLPNLKTLLQSLDRPDDPPKAEDPSENTSFFQLRNTILADLKFH